MGDLKAENITKSYDGRVIIKDVSLEVREGELVCLLGVSGAGKSTLFHVLSGLESPDSGRILLGGAGGTAGDGIRENSEEAGMHDITGAAGSVSYMFQKDLLFRHKKVIDNVALPLVIRGMKKKEAREKAAGYFKQFGLEGTELMYPSELSGGMRQRAALLRTYMNALVSAGGIALLDEPFSALDTITKSSIHAWYLDVMSSINLTTLFITHDIDEAILLSDRILILSGAPGTITGEILIEEPKPRPGDFNLTPEFIAYKRRITDLLRT